MKTGQWQRLGLWVRIKGRVTFGAALGLWVQATVPRCLRAPPLMSTVASQYLSKADKHELPTSILRVV
jgi:hypothetical protein